jgi:hypothetical protein
LLFDPLQTWSRLQPGRLIAGAVVRRHLSFDGSFTGLEIKHLKKNRQRTKANADLSKARR